MARRVLDVIADVLTLLAVTVAAIAHVAFLGRLSASFTPPQDEPWITQLWDIARSNVIGSGLCLGLLLVLVGMSLLVHAGPVLRRVWNLGMFATAAGSMLFQVMLITAHGRFRFMQPAGEGDGTGLLIMGIVATGSAIFFSLARMIWTMPSFKSDRTFHENVLPDERTLPTTLPEDRTFREGDRPPEDETHIHRGED